MHRSILAPSILAGNHANLVESLQHITHAGCKWIHLDIMDGHFVPNLTFGPQTVDALRKDSDLYFDTHLMLDNPHLYIEAFAKAGSNCITIHVEPDYPIKDTLAHIRSLGIHAGIALNPGTQVEEILPFLDKVDLVLAMTVQPGFGGQSFREEVLPKILEISQWRSKEKLNYRIEVDGGINLETAQRCLENGTDTFVMGTAFFKAEEPEKILKKLQK